MSFQNAREESGAGETRPGIQSAVAESKTIWTRLLLRQVSLETLRALNVGYEFDPGEPNSVLVKRTMSSEEQDVLFRHTSLIREERAAKIEAAAAAPASVPPASDPFSNSTGDNPPGKPMPTPEPAGPYGYPAASRFRRGISPSRRVASPAPMDEPTYARRPTTQEEEYYGYRREPRYSGRGRYIDDSTPRRERSYGRRSRSRSRSPPSPEIRYERRRDLSRSRERVVVVEEYRYTPPTDQGKPLKFDVNLVSLASDGKNKKGIQPAKVESTNQPEAVSIETSRRYSGDSGGEKVVLTTGLKTSTTTAPPSHLRWIHLEHKQMCFESLQRLILQTDELNNDDVLIALQLLRKVQEDKEKRYVHGYYLTPNVLRCDSRDVGHDEKPDRVCTFVSFPYFSYQSAPILAQKDGTHLHSARGLLQTLYYLESTKARDLEQVTRKLRPPKGNEAIYVAQMWAIVLGSDTLITYSTAPLEVMRGEKVQISNSITTIKTGPSTLRVTDPFERLFFFSLDECKTWFELTNMIHEQCMKSYSYSIDECNIFLKNDRKLKALSWAADIEAQNSAIVDIFVRFKDPQEIEEDEAEKDRRHYRSDPYGDDADIPELRTRDIRGHDSYNPYNSRRATGLTERVTTESYGAEGRRSPRSRIARRETQDRNDMALITRRRSPSLPYGRRRARSPSPPSRQESIQVLREDRQATRRVVRTAHDAYTGSGEAYEAGRERGPVLDREVTIVRHRRSSSHRPIDSSGVRRHRRGPRHVSGGVVVNESSKRTETVNSSPADIYYIPEKDKKENIPAVSVFKAEDQRSKREPESRTAGEQKEAVADRPKTPSGRHQSRSSTRVPPVKPSVPPILMWPVGRANPTSKPDAAGVKGTADQQASGDSNIVDLLDRVHDYLITDQYYDHSRLFLAAVHATRNDAVFKLVESEPPANIRTTTGADSSVPMPSDTTPAPGQIPQTDQENLRPIPKEESVVEPDYLQTIRKFYQVSGELLDAFLPANYPSPIANRYYGAMRKAIELVNKTQNHYFMREGKNTHRGYEATVFVIQDVRDDPEYVKHFNIKAPRKEFSACKDCLGNNVYKYESGAFEHLREVHFKNGNGSDAPSTFDLSHWIKKVDRLSVERCAEEQLRVLKRCGQHLFSLQMESREIRDGVSTDDKAHQARYRLPKALVEAFQRLVMLLIYVTHLLELIAKNSEEWISTRWEIEDDREYMKAYEHMMFLGTGAETNMSQGKLDLIQMIRMEDYTQSVSYEAVGPEYILAMVMNNLQGGINCTDLVDVYKEWAERLAYQVSQRPRKRLLRDFQYLSEEISVLINTLDDQWRVLENFRVCLYPGCFRITTETRISMYEIERQLISKIEAANMKASDDYNEIDRKVDRLVTQTKMSVEILDDDHGKAILVFTVVTLVFLPLSFVSSLLGMNTIDIRNQQTTQWLFWAIALPITIFVVLLALLVAYRYDEMREWIDRKTKTVPK